MSALHALTMLVLLAEPSWRLAAEETDLKVYAREKANGVREMKAEAFIDAPPERVWKSVRDVESYPQTMPYVEVSRIVAREGGDKILWLYSVVNAPLVSRRDYVIKLVDESRWKDGEGYFKVSWTADNAKAPEKPDNIVRVDINDGYWKLEPREGGKKTFVTYYIYTDPGGSLPKWVINKANGSAVPDVIASVRKRATAKK
jgi:uncharacterized membrane protein